MSNLGNLAALGLRKLRLHAVDDAAKEDVELLSTVAGDGAADGPDDGELEKSLQPECNLNNAK